MGFLRTADSVISHCRSADRGSSWFMLLGGHHHHEYGAIWSFTRITCLYGEMIATRWTTGSHWLTGELTHLPDDPANGRLLLSEGNPHYIYILEAIDQLTAIKDRTCDGDNGSSLIYLRHPNRTGRWAWEREPHRLSRETLQKIMDIRSTVWALFDRR